MSWSKMEKQNVIDDLEKIKADLLSKAQNIDQTIALLRALSQSGISVNGTELNNPQLQPKTHLRKSGKESLTIKRQFKNLQQLMDFFKDEETCKAYYEKARWGEKVICPHCESEKVYRTNRGYKCADKICKKKFSATVGTIFENSKIPLRTWFAAMFLISTSKKGVSSLQLATQLGITQKTAWFVLHRIREMLKDNGLVKNY